MSGLSGGQDVFGTVHDEPRVPRVRASLRPRAGILSGSDVRELGTGRHVPGCARDSGAATARASDRNRLGRGGRSDDPQHLRSRHLPVLARHLGACERRHQAMTVLAVVLLVGLGLVGLAMIPLGLPGLWVMVGGILAYGWLTDFRRIGVATIAIVLGLAFLGEIIENWIGFRYAKRYGGSTRSGWGAGGGRAGGAPAQIALGLILCRGGGFCGVFLAHCPIPSRRPPRPAGRAVPAPATPPP